MFKPLRVRSDRFGNIGLSVLAPSLAALSCFGFTLAVLPLTARGADHAAATAPSAATAPADAFKPGMIGNAELYMEIPLTGSVGDDTFAAGLQTALDAAKARKIREIVLRIDTTRGTLDEVNAVVDVIHKTQGQPFRFHALVQNAAWLTTPIVFACDTIHVTPTSTLGGEPGADPNKPKPKDKFTPIDPDDKDVLALAGNVTSHTPLPSVLLALTIHEAHVFMWKDDSGEIQVSEDRPPGVPDDKFIIMDADNNRLKLSGNDAVNIGLATLYTDTGKPPGVPRERAAWSEAMPKGKYYMTIAITQQKAIKAAAERKAKTQAASTDELVDKAKQVADFMNSKVDEADQNDPKFGSYKYYLEIGAAPRMTGGSIQEWQKRTDAAIKSWADVKQAADLLVSLNEEATKQKLDLKIDMDKVKQIQAQAVEKVQRLQKHRDDIHGTATVIR